MAEPRRIELQSVEDLQYLISNVRRGANEKIDQALPPMEGEGEDAMRKAVEEDVHDVCTNQLIPLLLCLLAPSQIYKQRPSS